MQCSAAVAVRPYQLARHRLTRRTIYIDVTAAGTVWQTGSGRAPANGAWVVYAKPWTPTF